MSTLPVSSAESNTWTEASILEKGINFLYQKKEELRIASDLWDAAQGTDYYCHSSKLASERVKTIAAKNKKEVKELNSAVKTILEFHIDKDPLSTKTQQLSKIAIAAQLGIIYFKSIKNDTYYPTFFNWSIRTSIFTAGQISFSAIALLIPTICLADLTNYPIRSEVYTAGKIAILAQSVSLTLRCLNRISRVNPAEENVKTAEQSFKAALSN